MARTKRPIKSPRFKAKIDRKSWNETQELFRMLEPKIRDKALKKGIREASKMMGLATRKAITQPGYKGDKDKGKYPPLSKNIKWVVRGRKRDKFVAGHVGANYKKAPHFHLYELGHKMVTKGGDTVGEVMGKHDFKRTWDETKGKQSRIVLEEVRKFTKSLDKPVKK